MSTDTFKALVVNQVEGQNKVSIEKWTDANLSEGDVLVDVEYSSFNYKDGLALAGLNSILRKFPIVPGIDYAGTVRSSENSKFKAGDKVILTGWGVGERWSGGFAQRARAKSEWLIKLPEGMTTKQAMAIGTAGLTAMLSVMALERYGITPNSDILVSGAAGGVGSVAVRLLSRKGYRVHALTGRPEQADFLKSLGATALVDRATMSAKGRPLQAEQWDGAIDVAGGEMLVNILASLRYGGAVAACGLAASLDLPATMFPFILRNIALLGVDSVMCPLEQRHEAWTRLNAELTEQDFAALTTEVELEAVPALAKDILAGQVRGRTVVKL
ncbi:MDR family oxidoreductase [Microvirga sp. W0021]|uniref:MDR family oxidoreductase n=1 Tax=Hohaiivirga grylli TaxID=3133970 RepID=A0ABV0BHA1_9HYPH